MTRVFLSAVLTLSVGILPLVGSVSGPGAHPDPALPGAPDVIQWDPEGSVASPGSSTLLERDGRTRGGGPSFEFVSVGGGTVLARPTYEALLQVPCASSAARPLRVVSCMARPPPLGRLTR